MKGLKALVLFTLLWAPAALSEGITGFWKHESEPGWIEIRFEEGVGTGTVLRNDKFPERVGTEILKDILADGNGKWEAKVYAARAEEYRDARLHQSVPDVMEIEVKVGFITRTLKWVRVAEVPAAPQP